jgi:hypothetical protein
MLYLFSDTQPDELDGACVLYSAETDLARRDFPEDLDDRKDQVDSSCSCPSTRSS